MSAAIPPNVSQQGTSQQTDPSAEPSTEQETPSGSDHQESDEFSDDVVERESNGSAKEDLDDSSEVIYAAPFLPKTNSLQHCHKVNHLSSLTAG
jgi:hypothetical protein